eukprot:g44749.t1
MHVPVGGCDVPCVSEWWVCVGVVLLGVASVPEWNSEDERTKTSRLKKLGVVVCAVAMTVLVVPATVPASAAKDASVPALTEVRSLTKRKRSNKASREKRKKRRKLESARQAAQQVAGGLGVLNTGNPVPVETPGQAEQRVEGGLGVLNTGKPAPVAMSSWLWMSFATSYSSDESLPLLMAFDDASPNCKAVQRCFTVEEVRNEEVHGKGYTKRAWTDFVDRGWVCVGVVLLGVASVPEWNSEDERTKTPRLKKLGVVVCAVAMTVLVVPATVPASAAKDASVPALTEVRHLTKRKRSNKASREKRKKRRKLENARQAAQQVAGGLGVLNTGKHVPVETPGQAEQRVEGGLGVLNTGNPAPVAMSSWLWMSFATSYSIPTRMPKQPALSTRTSRVSSIPSAVRLLVSPFRSGTPTCCVLCPACSASTCRLTLKKIRCGHRELVLKNSGVYIVAEQSHAVAVDCARRLIFNPCFEHASILDAKNLAAQCIPDTKEAIDVAKLVSTAL